MSTQTTHLSFDETVAASYEGKYLLVGLSYLDDNEKEVRRCELHGVIQSATREGVLIALKGVHEGEKWNMPPLLEVIRVAKPGVYTLATTNEKVVDPDLLAMWDIKKS